jgi:hypothetical protein
MLCVRCTVFGAQDTLQQMNKRVTIEALMRLLTNRAATERLSRFESELTRRMEEYNRAHPSTALHVPGSPDETIFGLPIHKLLTFIECMKNRETARILRFVVFAVRSSLPSTLPAPHFLSLRTAFGSTNRQELELNLPEICDIIIHERTYLNINLFCSASHQH